jgi:hypothetical protein
VIPPSIAALNEAQRRHLSVALGTVERVLVEISRLGGERQPDLVMHRRLDDLPAEELGVITRQAQAILTELQPHLTALDLPIESQSIRQHVAAFLTDAAVLLMDTHAKGLAAYGSMDSAAGAALDRWLDDLGDRLRPLLARVGTTTGDTR